MADLVASPTSTHTAAHGTAPSRDHHSPITPGKVAMWLFLSTEIMFFTGLIGSYIVLRSGSPDRAYSSLYPPATDLSLLRNTEGVMITSAGRNTEHVVDVLRYEAGLTEAQAEERLHELPHALI